MQDDFLWSVRPRLQADELLSSWLFHLAKGNGAKLQAFCDCAFGRENQLWNRDVDRLAPDWLLFELSRHTAVPLLRIRDSTLRSYEGRLFRKMRLSGQLRWILPLNIYHRRRLGYGLQFCPRCLAADEDPYFRKRWRVAFYTFCTEHICMLHERCPKCLSPVVFHRRELGRPAVLDPQEICLCSECDFDLRRAQACTPPPLDGEGFELMKEMLVELDNEAVKESCYTCLEFSDVLHQICKIMVSGRGASRLLDFVLAAVNAPTLTISKGRSFEDRSLNERHLVLQAAMWLMADPGDRLKQAWEAGAVRYNHLVKDMESPPAGFASIVSRFNRRNNSQTSAAAAGRS